MQKRSGGTLRFALDNEPVMLDPGGMMTLSDFHVVFAMYDTLFAIDEQLIVQPNLAVSWEYLTDTCLHVRLRQGVTFHDGTPLTAEQVVWSLRHLQQESSEYRSQLAILERVETLDAHTLRFHLHAPYTPLLSQLAGGAGLVLSPELTEVETADGINLTVHQGTGPFRLLRKTSEAVELVRYDRYWDRDEDGTPLPYADALIMPWLATGTDMLQMLEAGHLSFINEIPYAKVPSLHSREDIRFLGIPSHGFNCARLNVNRPPFDQTALRQAVAWAVDREEMLASVNLGVGLVSHGPIPPASWAHDESFLPYRPDPERIRELLTEGGCPDGFSFTIQIPAAQMLKMINHMGDQLRRYGIDMTAEVVEFPQMLENLTSGNFQAIFLGVAGGTDPDDILYTNFHSNGSSNYLGYSNPQVDRLLEQSRRETEHGVRSRLYREAQRLIVEDSPCIFTRSGLSMICKRSDVHEITPHPDMAIRWKRIWIEEGVRA
ncbi:peptide/nickel transport system substrate-binding protein [Tumebacillus sp. BK434]|uniref:ABC transporter substrate-binding protein n=1 Tax=Tumebacillus sp. BK434 TaxID=2512169 RepID=UPI0010478D5E|nr:ABC transporter substrate-binding protein [Tumebacillus sp. BK434]TCP53708.1 peptide/nickel transport system substrate-binding protein [Tumebacillus sp. BK434]